MAMQTFNPMVIRWLFRIFAVVAICATIFVTPAFYSDVFGDCAVAVEKMEIACSNDSSHDFCYRDLYGRGDPNPEAIAVDYIFRDDLTYSECWRILSNLRGSQ